MYCLYVNKFCLRGFLIIFFFLMLMALWLQSMLIFFSLKSDAKFKTKISNFYGNKCINWSQNLIDYLDSTAFFFLTYMHCYPSKSSGIGFTAANMINNFVEWQKIQNVASYESHQHFYILLYFI